MGEQAEVTGSQQTWEKHWRWPRLKRSGTCCHLAVGMQDLGLLPSAPLLLPGFTVSPESEADDPQGNVTENT